MNRIFRNAAFPLFIAASFALAIYAGSPFLQARAAFAQSFAKPQAGLWEVKTEVKAGFRKMSPKAVQRCLTEDAADIFDQFFIDPPPGEKDAPVCQMVDVRSDANGSTWKAQCVGPKGKLDGTGESTFSAASYKAKQKFKIGILTMTMTTSAKYLGPCGGS